MGTSWVGAWQVELVRLEVARPVVPVACGPVVDGHQAVGPQRVNAALRLRPDLDQAHLTQYPQVAGHRRLGQLGESGHQFAGSALAVGQGIQQDSPIRLGDRFEHVHPIEYY